jgi:hypothetical protein
MPDPKNGFVVSGKIFAQLIATLAQLQFSTHKKRGHPGRDSLFS